MIFSVSSLFIYIYSYSYLYIIKRQVTQISSNSFISLSSITNILFLSCYSNIIDCNIIASQKEKQMFSSLQYKTQLNLMTSDGHPNRRLKTTITCGDYELHVICSKHVPVVNNLLRHRLSLRPPKMDFHEVKSFKDTRSRIDFSNIQYKELWGWSQTKEVTVMQVSYIMFSQLAKY